MSHTFTLLLPGDEAPRLRRFFNEHGFELRDAPHAFWQARGPGCNATFYCSGKLVLQGKEADVYRGLLGDETPDARPFHRALGKHPKPAPHTWIGTDEAGKGDYFGPLVVAGVALNREPDTMELLATLGVGDSKRIADDRMADMVDAIRAIGAYEELVITPERYNELYVKMGNLNRMLAWAHGKVIENLLEKVPAGWILVDKFAELPVIRRGLGPRGRDTRLEARTKAEEDPAVAAASVLARSAYMRWLGSASRRFGIGLKPGAGAPTLTVGHRFVAQHGADALRLVGKLHFATTQQLGG